MRADILSNLVITRVHSVSTLYTAENVGMKRVNRPSLGILLKYEGETVYTHGGKHTVSNATHMVILPKGSSYEWQCTRGGHYMALELECNLTPPEPISVPIKSFEKILRALKELEYKRHLQGPSTELESLRDAYTILLELVGAMDERYIPEKKRRRLTPALEYICAHCTEPIKNDTLASLTGMSTVYFRKTFTEVMGLSPIAYVKRLRMEKAKEMLRSDYGTLTELSLSLGYPSLYDFSRAFKKHVGVAPSKYAIDMQ